MNTMKTNEMEVQHQGVTPQRRPWETPQIDAAMIALSTQKAAHTSESGTVLKNGS